MASNKKPPKKYRPRPVIADPLNYVINGFKPVKAEHSLRVKLINHGSLLALTRGQGTRSEWDYMCTALNVAVVLAEQGVGDDYIEDIKAAMQAHAQCGKRYFKGQSFGYTGEQLSAVNVGLEIHDAQMDIVTVAQMERAHLEVARRIKDKNFSHRVKELA